jgi:hypothetical protein
VFFVIFKHLNKLKAYFFKENTRPTTSGAYEPQESNEMKNTKLQRNGKHKMPNDNEMKKEIILKKHYFGDRTVISIKYFVCIYYRKSLIGLSYQVLALFLELI